MILRRSNLFLFLFLFRYKRAVHACNMILTDLLAAFATLSPENFSSNWIELLNLFPVSLLVGLLACFVEPSQRSPTFKQLIGSNSVH